MMRLLSVDRIDLRLSLSSSSPSSKMEEPSFAPNQSLRIAFFFFLSLFFLNNTLPFRPEEKEKGITVGMRFVSQQRPSTCENEP